MRHINFFGGQEWGVFGGGHKAYVEKVYVFFLKLDKVKFEAKPACSGSFSVSDSGSGAIPLLLEIHSRSAPAEARLCIFYFSQGDFAGGQEFCGILSDAQNKGLEFSGIISKHFF